MLGKRSVMPAVGPKKGKNFGGDIDLTALQFPDGLFKNADGSNATVHREWAMAKSGLFLAPPRNFQSIMEGKVEISKDEHSFLSTVKVLVPLPYEQEEIVIPASDGKQRALLKLYMVHLGEAKVQLHLGTNAQIDTAETHTLSLISHRDEWTDEAWMDLQKSPVKTILAYFENSRLQDVWGRAWQSQGKICSQERAELFACLCRAKPDQARQMLKQSGFTAMPVYVSPKPETKGADYPICYASHRVYWTAKDRDHCMKISMAHPHLGMVRNRKTFGLRVEDAVFQKIWGEERPADEVPKMIRIRSRWRVTGIPAFAEFGHVQKWLDQVKWRAKVLKKLRNCTWMVGADSTPPESTLSFNGQPILLEEMTGGTKHEPVIMAGSLDKSTAQQVQAAEDPWLQNDPWSKMKAPTGTNVTMRSTPAPTATAISAQDQKLQKMQEQLDGIAGRLQVHEQKTTHEVGQLRTEIKDSRCHLETTLQGALQKQSDQLMEAMQALLAPQQQQSQSHKSKNPTDGRSRSR